MGATLGKITLNFPFFSDVMKVTEWLNQVIVAPSSDCQQLTVKGDISG